jgi:hypothetical protein
VAILALEEDARLGFAGCFSLVIDGQNNDGPGMPDDIAAGAHAPRLFHFIGGDAEHRTPVTDPRRENASLP